VLNNFCAVFNRIKKNFGEQEQTGYFDPQQ